MAEFLRHDCVIFYCHGGSVDNCFTESLVGLLSYDGAHANLIADVRAVEGLYVADNRDLGARRFMRYRLCPDCRDVISTGNQEDRLKLHHCNTCAKDVEHPAFPEWMCWMDTDMSLQTWDALDQLLLSADPVERPIMSALYFGYMNNGNKIVPVWYGRDFDGRIVNLTKFGSGVQRLGVVGMGFCLIHRSVFEKFGDKYAHTGWLYFGHDRAPWTPEPNEWNDVLPFGEDNCFCHRCDSLGIPIHGNGSIVVEHRKKRYESLQTFLASFKESTVTTNEAGNSIRLRREPAEASVGERQDGVVEPDDAGSVHSLRARRAVGLAGNSVEASGK